MKFKTTKKAMKNGYCKIIRIGYCNLQHLLKYKNPIAYSTRAEGWACDYYDVDGVLISEGYAPLSSKNTHSTYEIEQEYDKAATEIISNFNITWENKADAVNELLKKYIQEVTEGE